MKTELCKLVVLMGMMIGAIGAFCGAVLATKNFIDGLEFFVGCVVLSLPFVVGGLYYAEKNKVQTNEGSIMTKNKQPRDNNGKFTKMIKVTDKFGNNAYFTPDEMAGFKATPKNPDCEPATKGYVKTLIGSNRCHTHNFGWNGAWIFIAGSLGWLATVILFMCYCIRPFEDGIIWIGMLLLFSITISMIYMESTDVFIEGIHPPTPDIIKKYTQPRKDECEE